MILTSLELLPTMRGFLISTCETRNYTFKIYENSIPDGYELENSEYQINLSSGEERNLQIELKSEKKKYYF